jgi:hypothetical protein
MGILLLLLPLSVEEEWQVGDFSGEGVVEAWAEVLDRQVPDASLLVH